MMAGTSPSIAPLANGAYEVGFQANTGNLWSVGGDPHGDWKLGMMAGTSPGIGSSGSSGSGGVSPLHAPSPGPAITNNTSANGSTGGSTSKPATKPSSASAGVKGVTVSSACKAARASVTRAFRRLVAARKRARRAHHRGRAQRVYRARQNAYHRALDQRTRRC